MGFATKALALFMTWNSVISTATSKQLRAESDQRSLLPASLPSLRLHFTLKRNSMSVYGASQFDVLANPVVVADGSVSYDGSVTFQVEDGAHSFLLVNGIAFHTQESTTESGGAIETSRCLAANELPPISTIISALNSATRTGTAQTGTGDAVNCVDGHLFATSFAGQPFVLCAQPSSIENAVFQINGADMTIDAYILPEAASIPKPEMSPAMLSSCETVMPSSAATATTAAILAGATVNGTASGIHTESVIVLPEATCSCKGTKRPCLFFNGLGESGSATLQDSSSYFGDIEGHAPCCSSIKYADINTEDYGWDSSLQQQNACQFALSMSSSSSATTKTIESTILVGHSMGNLLIAGALANGLCKLGTTSDWVAISGPMTGSMGSDYLQSSCASNGLVSAVANLIGKCPANIATKSLAYQGQSYASSTLNSEYAAAQAAFSKSVTAAMCSNSNSGLTSLDKVVYGLAGTIIPHKSSQNDGVVEYQSCAKGLTASKFASSYTSKFYVTKLNHADTAFRHGDSLLDDAKKPIKWFECLL